MRAMRSACNISGRAATRRSGPTSWNTVAFALSAVVRAGQASRPRTPARGGGDPRGSEEIVLSRKTVELVNR